ncbi:MAG: DUF2630 family protein [Chloroflexota bacterium]
MFDIEIRGHIHQLAREEEALWREASVGALAPAELVRLKEIKVELDQEWDLLHQREALRNAGLDPDQARVRAKDTVERYQQ